MKIIVCVKQVPDTTDVRIDPETNTLIREGVASVINPFDTYAIEEAVRLKEACGGEVIVLSMGPPQAADALREAISVGADKGILLSDRAFAGSDTLATSYTLAKGIQKIGNADLVICGKQASDGDTAQVGPGIASHLDIPQATYVKKIEKVEHKCARVERMIEEGYEVLDLPLPCLLTVVKEINEPRLPSLKGKMKAKKAEILTWTASDIGAEPAKIGLQGSPTKVVKIFTPPPREGGQLIEGEPEEVADALAQALDGTI